MEPFNFPLSFMHIFLVEGLVWTRHVNQEGGRQTGDFVLIGVGAIM
jgi:hypothetical protein